MVDFAHSVGVNRRRGTCSSLRKQWHFTNYESRVIGEGTVLSAAMGRIDRYEAMFTLKIYPFFFNFF